VCIFVAVAAVRVQPCTGYLSCSGSDTGDGGCDEEKESVDVENEGRMKMMLMEMDLSRGEQSRKGCVRELVSRSTRTFQQGRFPFLLVVVSKKARVKIELKTK
jgi:hypothetical protein